MKLIDIINEFVVSDMEKSIKFYQQNLGFKIELTEPENEPFTWVQMNNGQTRIMLEDYKSVCREIKDFPNKTNSINLIKFKYDNTVEEIKQYYHRIKEKEIELFMELKETDYGMIEFGILDPDKNRIIISS